jgi:hypothetical protein
MAIVNLSCHRIPIPVAIPALVRKVRDNGSP